MAWTRRELVAMLSALAAPRALAVPVPPCALAVPLDAIAAWLLARAPELGVRHGVPDALNGGPLARRLDDWSPEGEAAWRAALAGARQAVAGLACAGDPRGARHLAVAGAALANAGLSADVPYGHIDAFGFAAHLPYVVSPIAGPHVDTVSALANRQSLASPGAVDAWIAKLDGLARAIDGLIAKLRADAAASCRPPRALLAATLPVLDAFLAGPASAHPLILALRTRTAAAALDPALRCAAEARAELVLERSARPAFARLRVAVAAMAGRGEAGVWAQPEGDALYAANVRVLGDTALAPAEVHRLGLAETRRIAATMDRALRRRGLAHGSVGARMAALAADPRQRFASDEEALARAAALVRAMEARYPLFLPAALIPRVPLEVRRLDDAPGAAPLGLYDAPSLDGARPGTVWLNLADPDAVARFRLPTLIHHEGVPGHHTQGAIAAMQGEAPLLARMARFNAYQEGWAVYAERLAAELGAFARDPLGDLGRLQDELFRAARLVVDTGLHHERWSRERAIAWLGDTAGLAPARCVAEVERYMAWPGQALGYKLGQLRLLAMRAGVARARGRRFSRKAFHAAVLANGAMPLDMLEAAVRAG